jgi:hypothetical protein
MSRFTQSGQLAAKQFRASVLAAIPLPDSS